MRVVATCWAPRRVGLLDAVRGASAILRATSAPHLVEARLDLLDRPADADLLAELARAAQGRLLVTCRPGGSGSPSGRDRHGLLLAAARAGAVAVDVEHEEGADGPVADVLPGALPAGCEVVLSRHVPDTFAPSRGKGRGPAEWVVEMSRRGPSVVKLAAPAGPAGAALDWVVAAAEAAPPGVACAPVPLGWRGTWLRLLAGRPCELPGGGRRELSALTYVAASAPLPGADLGQPCLREAAEVHAVHRVGPDTELFAVVGFPLEATWSPALHGRLFRRRALDAIMVPLPSPTVGEAMDVLARLGAAGAAVTMPHKGPALQACEVVAPAARAAGGVNTLGRSAAGWEGESFDGQAAHAALAQALGPVAGRRVVILGSGGAAAAATAALVPAGARVTVLARDRGKARAVAQALGAEWGGLAGAGGTPCDAVVNATPVGAVPGDAAAMPIPEDDVHGEVALDMVTTPPQTAFLAAARRRGMRTVDGLAMLARQAAAQQRWWWGRRPARPGEAPPLSDADVEAELRALVDAAAARPDPGTPRA
jgi:shikimate dehydrogenase